jgi:hypothetical protein
MKSYYKCPTGWTQKIIDIHNGYCYNQWVDPNWHLNYPPPESTDYHFKYGPKFNKYPNNDNIPDVSFDQKQYYSLNSMQDSVAPDSWFYFKLPLGWPYKSAPINPEPNQLNYTCPYGWTQYPDDNLSGKCKSEFFNYAQNKPGPLYTIYYGPKYNKWPNNNKIPSITDLLTNFPSESSVATPDNFYYSGNPPHWWPNLSGSNEKLIYYEQPNSPSIVKPRIVTPSIVTPRIVTPSIVTPSIVTPTLVTPSIVTPSIVSPNIVSPNIVSPNIVSPNIGTSKSTSFPIEYIYIIICIILVLILLCVILI